MKIRKRTHRLTSIPMSSMADIAFLLLVFLIVTTTISQEAQLELPVSSQTEPIRDEKYLVLSVKENDQFYMDGVKTDLDSIEKTAQMHFRQNPGRIVIIRGDSQVPYSAVSELIDTVQKSGLRNTVLATEEKK